MPVVYEVDSSAPIQIQTLDWHLTPPSDPVRSQFPSRLNIVLSHCIVNCLFLSWTRCNSTPDQTTSFYNPPFSHPLLFIQIKSTFKLLLGTFFLKDCKKSNYFREQSKRYKLTGKCYNKETNHELCRQRVQWMDEVSMDLVLSAPSSSPRVKCQTLISSRCAAVLFNYFRSRFYIIHISPS